MKAGRKISLSTFFSILKWMGYAVTAALLVSITFVFSANYLVVNKSKAYIHDQADELPDSLVGLVLGTSKYVVSGRLNEFFESRMQAAAELYHMGKVKHLIVSGDNRQASYNEPRDMYRRLVELGVPGSAITLDYAGFRTLDSVIRSQKIFQQSNIIIISQAFHNHRAIFIARHHGLEAYAYSAQMPVYQNTTRTSMREVFARCKAVIDVYILRKQPYFLGETIDLEV